MKISRPAILVPLLLLAAWLALIGAVIGVIGSSGGTRWTLQWVQRLAPGLSFEQVDGSLLQGLHVDRLRWRDADVDITLETLDLRVHWPALLRGQLDVSPLSVRELTIRLTGEDKDDKPVQLPRLEAPLRLNAPTLSVQKLAIVDGDTVFELLDLRADAAWSGTRLQLRQAEVRWQETRLEAHGTLDFRGDYALKLQGELRTPELEDVVAVTTDGDLRHLKLSASTNKPYPVHADAELATLDTNLPLSARLTLTSPEAMLVPELPLTAQSGTLQVQGDLTRIDGTLQLALQEPHYGASKLAATLQWLPGQLQSDAQLTLTPGDLHSNCALQYDDAVSWSCKADVHAIPLTPWLPQFEGELSGPIAVDGTWRDKKLQLAVELPAIQGRLGTDALTGQLKVATEDGLQWTVPQLAIAAGPNRVQASGMFGTRNRLQLDIAAGDLAHIGSALGGAVSGNISIEGASSSPAIRGHLRGERLRYEDISIAQANATFNLPRLAADNSRTAIELKTVSIGEQPAFDARLTSNGTRDQQRSSLVVQQRDNRAALDCATRASSAYADWQIDCPSLQLSLHAGRYNGEWRNNNALRGSWKGDGQRFELTPFCLGAADASLCLDTPLRYEQQQLRAFSIRGRALPVNWISAWLPEDLRLDDAARATLHAELKSVAPLQLQAGLNIPQTRWSWRVADKRQRAEIDDIALALQLDDRSAQLQASATSPTIGAVAARLNVRDPRGTRALDGNIELNRIDLAGLAWLVDGLDALSGQVNGAIRIDGTAAAPQLHGRLLLADGMANWPPLGAPFRNVHVNLDFDNNAAKIGGWFALGEGGGDIDGSIDWTGNGESWRAHLGLVAGGISAAPLPQSNIVLSPHIDLDATQAETHIKGYVDIASAEIHLKELPPETIDVSQDARIVGQQPPESALKLWADIGLNLGDRFHFQGLGADVNLAGRLRLRQQPGDLPQLTGEVTIPKGRYRAYGQRLSIRRGSFIFYGPWSNPDLNLEAVRELPPGVTDVVGMRIIGSLKTPEAILFSEPSMPDSDIARYLLTGRKPSTAPGASQFSASGALLSLGLSGSEDRASKLAQKFGITDLQLGTAQGANGEEAELSGQLSQDLYVRYGRGLGEASNSITFQYKLTPQLMIETISGIENALDLLYSFSVK